MRIKFNNKTFSAISLDRDILLGYHEMQTGSNSCNITVVHHTLMGLCLIELTETR